jgi:phage FluMu protein Com
MIDDKVKIRCPHCTKLFRDRAHRVRDGYQVNCGHCNRLLTLNRDTEDPHLRRALKAAGEMRNKLEQEANVRRAGSQAW